MQKIVSLRPYPKEPDPDMTSIELEARNLNEQIVKTQIMNSMKRGKVNVNQLVREYYDPTDAFMTKEDVKRIVEDAMQDLVGDLKGHDVFQEILGYWLQSDLMIQVQNDALQFLRDKMANGDRVSIKDLTALVNSNATLWKDRFAFMRFLGVIQPGVMGRKGQEASKDMSKIFDTMLDEADDFEEAAQIGYKVLSEDTAL